MLGDLLGSMGKQQAKNIAARRSLPAGARSEFAQSLRSFAGSLPARRGGEIGICAVASLLCRLPSRSPRGPLQNCGAIKELRGSESRYSVLGEQAS